MFRKLLMLGLLAATFVGCGPSQATPVGAAVSVTGSVTASGKPVGNVTLKLQPLEQGYEKFIPIGADGKFTVETQPGKYAYSFAPKEGTKTVPAPAAGYVQASMERTVQVAAGQPLTIDLK